MEAKTKAYFIIIIALGITIIAFSFLLINRGSANFPKTEVLEDCKTIQNPGGSINVVFFSSKESAEKYTDFFLKSSPFSNYKDSFNFFYIDNFQPQCELYKDIALYCSSSALREKAASCPNDYIIVLDSLDKSIRSSAYQNVISININHALNVLLHEFGHAFSNLAEEYTPAAIPRGSENCVSSCTEFKGETDGCFQGCSKSNFYRSIDNGIMRTLSTSEFGIFNKNIITNLIIEGINKKSKITGLQISKDSDCPKQKYILYNVKSGEKFVKIGCAGGNGDGPNYYQIIKDGEVIVQENFANTLFTDVQSETEDTIEGETFLNQNDNLFLTLPYSAKKADEIKLFDADNNLISRLSLKGIGARPCEA